MLFHDKRLVIELTAELVVLRGNGGGSGSEDELFGDSSNCDRCEEVLRPGMYDLTSGRALYAADTF